MKKLCTIKLIIWSLLLMIINSSLQANDTLNCNLKGDYNNDCKIDIKEVICVMKSIAGLKTGIMPVNETFTNDLGMTFVYVTSGTFMMGSPTDELGHESNERQHQVAITKGYFMQTTEVTQGQWKAVTGKNPSSFKNCGENCPVECVTWNDVQKFIELLNQKESTNKYRLPTEAEWEYAARAGSSTAFANGNISERFCEYDPKLDAMGWYCGNSESTTNPVAQKLSNAWGLYDMHGNVWEWCQDFYDAYPTNSVTDPVGPSSGLTRVIRSGSWGLSALFSRSASRYQWLPDAPYDNLGFRLIRREK